jgi:hypothetical protein
MPDGARLAGFLGNFPFNAHGVAEFRKDFQGKRQGAAG